MLRTPLLRVRPAEALPNFADPIVLVTAEAPDGSDPRGYIVRERPPVDPSSLRVSVDETWDESVIGVEEDTLFQIDGYELVLLAQPYPRARMDMNAAHEELVNIPLDVLFWSTSRIDLEVAP